MVQKLTRPVEGKRVLGVTGGFGTGKSTVARMFEECGAQAVDADQLAHEALSPGSPVYDAVIKLFGSGCFDLTGRPDRKKIAAAVFGQDRKRKELEALVHPYVFEKIAEKIRGSSKPWVVVEIPLLFETGYEKNCYRTLVVEADPGVARARLKQKGFDEAEIQKRAILQMPLDEKKKRTDFVVNNSGSLPETREQVLEIWKKINRVPKGEK